MHLLACRLAAATAAVALLSGIAATALMPRGQVPALDIVFALHMPKGMEARSTALFITGSAGWTAEHETRAERLAELHTMVIGVDGPELIAAAGGCTDLPAILTTLARHLQSREGALARMPVLIALADGADIAAHAATGGTAHFKGLVTHGFGIAPRLCPGAPALEVMGAKAPVRWLDVVEPGATSPAATIAGTRIVPAKPEIGPRRAFYRAYLGVAGTDSSFDTNNRAPAAALGDLPLTIHHDPDAPATDTYAIFLSGDGGWAKFSLQISERLAARGIPVVGISALRYLWQRKTPTRIAGDFARIDRHYRRVFSRNRVLLIGFSIGANTVPFAAAQLPPDLAGRIAGAGLIAPEALTGFEIVVGGWLGQQTGATPVPPGIVALAGHIPANRIACLHGTDETASACPDVDLPGMRRVAFPGGHHLGKDHDRVVETLLEMVGPDA